MNMQLERDTNILVIGEDASGCEKWKTRLERAGFDSVRALMPNALKIPPRAEIAVFVPMNESLRNQAARMLRSVQSQIKLVFLYDGAIKSTEMADAVIHTDCDDDDLIRTLHYLVKERAIRRMAW